MSHPEQEWARQIRNGDRQAFKKVFHVYYPGLCAFATEYVKSYDRARDLVQDVFLNIWERRAEWELHGSLKAYLYQAVRNRALNALRNRDTRRRAQDTLQAATASATRRTAEDALYHDQLSDAVQAAIDELPERRRMVFLLHRQHGFTYKEIAAIMDIAPKTVENQMGRALKFLRQYLTQHILSGY